MRTNLRKPWTKSQGFPLFLFLQIAFHTVFFSAENSINAPFLNFSLSQKLLLIFLPTSVKVMSVKIERQRI